VYVLTEKGLDLLPILLEMAGWSVQHDPRFCNRAAVIDWREVIRRVMEHQRRDIDLWCQNLIDNGGADVSNVAALVNAAYRHYLERIGRLPRPMTDDYAEVIGSRRVTVAESHGTIVG